LVFVCWKKLKHDINNVGKEPCIIGDKMTQLEAKKLIERERLQRFNWFDEHPLREDEVGIRIDGNQWVVYVTDERASVVTGSVKKFDNERDALDNFIKRLRTEKI
jgi:hypothetical protein